MTRAVLLMLVTLVSAGVLSVVGTTSPAQAAPVRVWDRLARCESGGNWHINTGNGYYGGLQFSGSTWRAFGGGKFARAAHRASKVEQIRIAERVRRHQGWGAWPACSSRIGLR
ncbi:MAG TPA: transglycosylase family protein [Nocardioides sp.]|uniref:transglycosylase family protein n=1 Tax=Nocardioides sp. TaxID=35761 RepID=UPI002D80108B|nr:transglycosylase family protein [Nocardioides sp.]HET6654021.1 transglycosylase family protein [Nocardioides sp.]